jgi:hypothetical protein
MRTQLRLLGCLALCAAALPAAAGDEVIAMRGSRVEVAALPVATKGVDALRGTRRGGGPDLDEGTLRVGQSGRSALRAQLRAMVRTLEEHLGRDVPPSAFDALPLLGDRQALRGVPGPGVTRAAFEQRELEQARLDGARALLRAAVPNAPPWLEVGFAQYFEGIEVAGGATAVYAQPAQDAALRLALAQGRLLPLEDVVRRDAAGFGASVDGVLASAQAWSLVYWLMEQGESHETMRSVIAELARDPDASLRGLARPYGSFGQLEREWRDFVGRSRRAHLLFLTDDLRRALEQPDEPLVYERNVLVRSGFYPAFYGGLFVPKGHFFKRRGFGRPGFHVSKGPGYGSIRFKSRPGSGRARFGDAPHRSGFKGKSGFKRKSGFRGKRGGRGRR